MNAPQNEMRIKIKNSFLNPKTHMFAKAGECYNVPKNRFWLKRLEQKDVVEVSEKEFAEGHAAFVSRQQAAAQQKAESEKKADAVKVEKTQADKSKNGRQGQPAKK